MRNLTEDLRKDLSVIESLNLGTFYIRTAELKDLLAVVEAARGLRGQVCDYKTIHNRGTHVEAHIRVNTLAEFDQALAKLDEVHP